MTARIIRRGTPTAEVKVTMTVDEAAIVADVLNAAWPDHFFGCDLPGRFAEPIAVALDKHYSAGVEKAEPVTGPDPRD